VHVVAAVEENERNYLVMEYVAGGSLRDLLEGEGQLPIERAVDIALDVADALTRAHRLGIIHRDLKPANVLLAEDGTLRLSDFGLVQMADSVRLTRTGTVVGTILYLSPEACQGQRLDARADIWSFGVMLYEMLTGEPPFMGATLPAVFTAILTQPVPDLSQVCPDVPDALADLVYRMLEKDRQQRIPSVRLVGAELEAMLAAVSGQPSTARERRLADERTLTRISSQGTAYGPTGGASETEDG
jgi:serine/threonine-protein kinase